MGERVWDRVGREEERWDGEKEEKGLDKRGREVTGRRQVMNRRRMDIRREVIIQFYLLNESVVYLRQNISNMMSVS
jgi:hypothetical protein